MAYQSRKIASRVVVVMILVSYLWPEGSRAQGGFGVHPLGTAMDLSSGFQLLGEPLAVESRHLQMVPRSLRSRGDAGSGGGYGLHDYPALNLYERGQISLEDALKRLVRDSVGPLLGIKAHAPDGNGAILLSFQAAGVNLCFFGVRGAAIFGREILLQGQIPDVMDWPTPASLDDWPDLDESASQAMDTLERTMGGPVEHLGYSLGDSSRCFATDRGSLKPAWHLTWLQCT